MKIKSKLTAAAELYRLRFDSDKPAIQPGLFNIAPDTSLRNLVRIFGVQDGRYRHNKLINETQ